MTYSYLNLLLFIGIFLSLIVTIVILKIFDIIDGNIARKCTHILSGTLYCVCWALMPDYSFLSKFFWSMIPGFSVLLLLFLYLNIFKFQIFVNIMSRQGRVDELIKGPFIYGIFHTSLLFISCNKLFGAVASSVLCGGDGFAEIIGKRCEKKFPFSDKKTIGGTFAFFIFASLFANLLSIFLIKSGFTLNTVYSVQIFYKIEVIAFVCAIVESLIHGEFDNIGIAVVALSLGWFVGF
eukprot:TRINITY_DN1233_c0_g1_i1.p1 TRINITY_DN1233_c0_g1~~TRINITY_DN1233_c0_g1_i1.p1  ORF type:complete len:237 (+),score=43.86 TRINITY_DN1233_c0_g1_i1:60-770(+)